MRAAWDKSRITIDRIRSSKATFRQTRKSPSSGFPGFAVEAKPQFTKRNVQPRRTLISIKFALPQIHRMRARRFGPILWSQPMRLLGEI
jgi:hypothetical protein